jgi:hypothetical protein
MLFWEPVDLYILKLPGVEMDEGIAAFIFVHIL